MATIMLMRWPEVTKEQYEQIRRDVKWEESVPDGAKLHVSWFGQDGFHVFDLWDSRAHFEQFLQQRLMPGVQKADIKGQPKVDFADSHAIFAPNP
jgi:hypothetical protein